MKIVYKTIHGSHAYGLNGPKSDMDIRGVFLSDPMEILGLHAGKQTFKGSGEDEVYWELKHFVRMCLQGNPNALEILFTKTEHQEINLLGSIFNFRDLFLTKQCRSTFGGYAVQNLRKLKNSLLAYATDEAIRKDSMHLVRLLLFSKQILGESHLKVFFEKTDPDKNMLMSIRAGIIPAIEVVNYAEKSLLEIDEMATRAPEMEDEVWNLFDKLVSDMYWSYLKETVK
jgi:predicted nucleotidyltransferase